jgi:hypothetical protein
MNSPWRFTMAILGGKKVFIEDQWRMIAATDFFTLPFSNVPPPRFAVCVPAKKISYPTELADESSCRQRSCFVHSPQRCHQNAPSIAAACVSENGDCDRRIGRRMLGRQHINSSR